MSHLVIVESPNKVKTIKKYLGDNYEVLASIGHVVKMPASGDERLGIDFDNWEPIYKIEPSKKDIIKALKTASEKAETVFIATDPDREGEAIGENLITYLNIKNKYKRIRYNEITKDAILHAIKNPTTIDDNLVKAQKSRRMLDRIIGFRLSNLMTKKMANYPTKPTAGRVQSIALKLVVDRENEIRNFVPVEYATISAQLNQNFVATYYNPNGPFDNKEWINREIAKAILTSLKGPLEVVDLKISKKNDAKIVPLKQAVLYKKADLSSKATQAAAQRLYEGYGDGGLISYPRTDSTRLSASFLESARAYISKIWGKEYLAEDIKGFSGDQDAHEAIRPTDIKLTPEQATLKYQLSSAEQKVYALVYYTTLKAIMKPAQREIFRYELINQEHQFKLSASRIIFDGYLILDPSTKDNELPKYQVGQKITVQEYLMKEHATKPPAAYTDGSLIEKLDEIKVGRPSTFASTVEKILDRQFVKKEGQSLRSTEFGEQVIAKLIEGFPNEITEDYTARVEADLDLIADGEIDYRHVMQSFWDRFNDTLKTAELTLERTVLLDSFVGEICPECGAELVHKKSKKLNQAFIGCSAFPECTYAKNNEAKKSRFSFAKKFK